MRMMYYLITDTGIIRKKKIDRESYLKEVTASEITTNNSIKINTVCLVKYQ